MVTNNNFCSVYMVALLCPLLMLTTMNMYIAHTIVGFCSILLFMNYLFAIIYTKILLGEEALLVSRSSADRPPCQAHSFVKILS